MVTVSIATAGTRSITINQLTFFFVPMLALPLIKAERMQDDLQPLLIITVTRAQSVRVIVQTDEFCSILIVRTSL